MNEYNSVETPSATSHAATPIQSLHNLSVDQILESAPDGMFIVGSSGEIVYLNTIAAKMFGYERVELLGIPIEALVPEKARPAHAGHRQGYLAEPRVRMMETGLQLYGLRKDKSQFPIEISLSPLRAPGQLLVLGAVRDKTRKQHTEAQIQILNQDLEARLNELDAVNRELQEFTYTTAHDLRAPIRHIQGYAEIVHESAACKLSRSELRELEKIASSARRLGLLIDGLLEFSRIGRIALRYAPFDVRKSVEAIQASLQGREGDRRIRWQNGDFPAIRGDRALLDILLTQLLDNALKFTRPRDEAIIATGAIQEDGAITLFVKDNGVGFDMQYAGKLFRPFQRMHGREEFEGTGIGLATVRRIAERHNGKVRVESVSGRGSTFFVSLPQRGEHRD